MAVIKVYPNLTTEANHGELDEHAERTYVVTWMVETDDPRDGVQVVGDAPGLPRLRAVYVFGNDVDLGSICKRITPRRIPGNQTLWTVEVEYASRNEIDLFREDRDPLMRPIEKEWTSESYQDVMKHDIFGGLIGNTNNEEFDPPVMGDRSRLVLTVRRNEAAANIPFIFSFLDCVNTDAFQGFAPGEARLTRLSTRRQVENAQEFWETFYEFHFQRMLDVPGVWESSPDRRQWLPIHKFPPWNKTIMNAGFHERLVAGGPVTRILDVAQPVKLTIDGLRAPINEDARWVSFKVYTHRDFAPLGIP